VTAPLHANPVFDRLLDEAVPALLAGEHRRDEPPVDGGRWPVSVVAVPDERDRDVLAGVMAEALAYAGPGHFETGRTDASHVTVRALEPYREAASPADPLTAEWVAALEEMSRESTPIRLRLTGVTLSVSGVMVQAEPLDDAPWALMRRLGAALGPLAWFEDQWQQRDIWYSSVLHFAGPLRDAPGLVAWARRNRQSLAHDIVLDALTLTRFRYNAARGRHHMAMERWHSVDLAAA
jgi:hypothetical protein